MIPKTAKRPVITTGTVMRIGMGGFLDGILFIKSFRFTYAVKLGDSRLFGQRTDQYVGMVCFMLSPVYAQQLDYGCCGRCEAARHPFM
jgi:hypothetical protein